MRVCCLQHRMGAEGGDGGAEGRGKGKYAAFRFCSNNRVNDCSSQALHDVYEQIKMLDYTRSNLCYAKLYGCMSFGHHYTRL